MNLDEARDFIRDHHRAVMLTHRQDGAPQMSPIVVGVDGDGTLLVSTRETAMKAINLRRDPRTSLCVVSDEFFGPWIRVDGRAEVVSLPQAMDGLVEYYRGIRGEHDDWDEYRQAMRDDQRCLVRITVEEAGPDQSG